MSYLANYSINLDARELTTVSGRIQRSSGLFHSYVTVENSPRPLGSEPLTRSLKGRTPK